MLTLEHHKIVQPNLRSDEFISDPYVRVTGVFFPRMMVDAASRMTKSEYERFLGETLLKQMEETKTFLLEFKPEPEFSLYTMF